MITDHIAPPLLDQAFHSPDSGAGANTGKDATELYGPSRPTSLKPNYGIDFNARLYAKVSQFVQVPSAAELLREHSFVGNETILDSGSGDGYVTRELLLNGVAPGGKVIGMDVNAGMVDWAQRTHIRNDNASQLSFVQGDVRMLSDVVAQLGLRPCPFQVVFSNYAHHWMFTQEDKDRAYTAIHGVLADDGILLDRLLREGSFEELIEPAVEVACSKTWKKFFGDGPIIPRMAPLSPIVEALDKAHFSKFSVTPLENVREFKSEKDLTHWFAACFRTFMTPIEKHFAANPLTKRRQQLLFARDVVSEFLGSGAEEGLMVVEKLTQIKAWK